VSKFRPLTDAERQQLERQGCTAADWGKVQVAGPCAGRIHNVRFLGEVRLGALEGAVKLGAIEEPCGIRNATLKDVTVGADCLIRNVGSHLANYQIGDGTVIVDVGLVEADSGDSFGCGSVVEALNEAGGRGVPLYPELSAQVAHLLSLHRWRPQLVKRLEEMIGARVAKARLPHGIIGAKALIRGVHRLRNVNIGPAGWIEDAACLENGTILSEPAAPAVVGSGVVAREFIIAEGASVTDGAILAHCYVGQGTKIGRQFSAENCLFFANCEAFHGEGCSLFAGPYSVTHHKSTLMIAAMTSFYNAGSGTNQSNHMYKLGPVHQGIMERGAKTGSFSYLLWPCRVGPFSVVMGKNMANFDLGDLPFSYIIAEGSKSEVTPGFNIFTVGTVRDGAKWPSRDRRKGAAKRDLINFPVFSPYTAGRMMRGEALLGKLAAETPRTVEDVSINGALCKRLLLKTGAKFYRTAIDAYLAEKLVARAEPQLAGGLAAVRQRLAAEAGASGTGEWLDISGLLVARERFEKLAAEVESGAVGTLEALQAKLAECHAAYERDEWNWVAAAWAARFGKPPAELGGAELAEAAARLAENRGKFLRMVLADAEKEFSDIARIGFGADGPPEAAAVDFEAVRGSFEKNKFVKEMKAELAALEKRCGEFKAKAEGLK
jgi:hypothetical protein